MKPTLIPAPRVSPGSKAARYSQLALKAHDRSCRECGSETSDSRCPAGERFEAATRTDRSWIRDYGVH